ncbi:hypothetical protein CISG_08300 [Coccidioides immitis RMSCC 3703]|uniref:Uncharacterized protein n=1 Tax=Coccidioides immitis RMSCC 3703 TaxID=454286 RepID=A0A0J8U1D1_COCIT|nr:hypothetical protein CISG_08300 [Coccidioides immitis RMSCC 3703]
MCVKGRSRRIYLEMRSYRTSLLGSEIYWCAEALQRGRWCAIIQPSDFARPAIGQKQLCAQLAGQGELRRAPCMNTIKMIMRRMIRDAHLSEDWGGGFCVIDGYYLGTP